MEGGNIRAIPIVSQFLTSGKSIPQLEAMQERYRLPVNRADEYLTLCRAVMDGDIELSHMPEMIAEAFGVDGEVAKKIACDVAGIRLLPLENYIAGVGEQIVKWGGKVADYTDLRVGKEKITADRFAGNLTESLELPLQPVHIKRLGFLVKSYFTGEKTREATMTFFARPVNIGGLGLPLEDAKMLIESVDESKELVEFVDDVNEETFKDEDEEEVGGVGDVGEDEEVIDEKVEVPVITNLPEVALSMEVSTTTPVMPEVILAAPEVDTDKQDIVKQAQVSAKKDIANDGNSERLKAAVDKAVVVATTTLTEKRLAKKDFAAVAEKAIRGVREEMQTRSLFLKDYGLDEAAIDKLMVAIADGKKFYDGARVELSLISRLRPTLSVGGEGVVKSVVPTAAEVMDKRFAEVTKTLPKASIKPVLDEARVSAARSKEDEVAGQAAKIDQAKLEVAAEKSKPVMAKTSLTVGSVPPPLPGEPATMNDVKFTSRLVGPVDELGTMLPADFRRLSSDPVEATRKIEDLLAALQTTAYEERIRGIQAWRNSPVCRLYAAMAGEALQAGIALAEVATKRRNKGEESLSPAEIKAIGSLNAKMRF
jgi:hypothetical protein